MLMVSLFIKNKPGLKWIGVFFLCCFFNLFYFGYDYIIKGTSEISGESISRISAASIFFRGNPDGKKHGRFYAIARLDTAPQWQWASSDHSNGTKMALVLGVMTNLNDFNHNFLTGNSTVDKIRKFQKPTQGLDAENMLSMNSPQQSSHVIINFIDGSFILIAQLFRLSSTLSFCYGLNLTKEKGDYPKNNNHCPPCLCSAVFSTRSMVTLEPNQILSKLKYFEMANEINKLSRFVPCLPMTNGQLNISKPGDIFIIGDTPTLKAEPSRAVRQLFRDHQMPLVLEGGTLLGWYRNCCTILDDVDVDFSVPNSFINNQFYKSVLDDAYLRSIPLRSNYQDPMTNQLYSMKLTRIFGDLEYGVEMRFEGQPSANQSESPVGVDVFVLYLDNLTTNYAYVQGFVTWEHSILHYALPSNLTLCSAIFLGELFLVPCEPGAYLESHYGTHWNIPARREENYWYTQPNVVKKIKLTSLDWKRRIMYKGFE